MNAAQHADVLILGGGSAGYSCALRASQLGMSVTLIEADKLGGTCLHRGAFLPKHCCILLNLPTIPALQQISVFGHASMASI